MEKEPVKLFEDQPQASRPKKKARHFILLVPVIALLLLIAGEPLGALALRLVYWVFPAPSDGVVFVLENYFPFVGIVAAVLLYCLLAERPLLRGFWHARRGGLAGNSLPMLGLGLLLGFVTNGVCILVAWLHGDLHFSFGSFEPLYLLFALLIVCIQSGAEELLTRGYMMGALRERYPVWLAALLNSVFFAALHLLNPGISALAVADLVLYGLAMSVVMWKLDSLWMCIAVHTMWNFTQNFLFGLPNSGLVSESSLLRLEAARESWAYDPAFGVEGTIVAVLVECLFILGVFLWARRKKA